MRQAVPQRVMQQQTATATWIPQQDGTVAQPTQQQIHQMQLQRQQQIRMHQMKHQVVIQRTPGPMPQQFTQVSFFVFISFFNFKITFGQNYFSAYCVVAFVKRFVIMVAFCVGAGLTGAAVAGADGGRAPAGGRGECRWCGGKELFDFYLYT